MFRLCLVQCCAQCSVLCWACAIDRAAQVSHHTASAAQHGLSSCGPRKNICKHAAAPISWPIDLGCATMCVNSTSSRFRLHAYVVQRARMIKSGQVARQQRLEEAQKPNVQPETLSAMGPIPFILLLVAPNLSSNNSTPNGLIKSQAQELTRLRMPNSLHSRSDLQCPPVASFFEHPEDSILFPTPIMGRLRL